MNYSKDGKRNSTEAMLAVVAVGCAADITGLNVAAAGVEINQRKFVMVDEYLRTRIGFLSLRRSNIKTGIPNKEVEAGGPHVGLVPHGRGWIVNARETWYNLWFCFSGGSRMRRILGLAAVIVALSPSLALAGSYKVTYLVSDLPGLNAQITDPLLQNPWGIALSASSPFWISNAGSLSATVYSGDVGGRPLMKSPTEVHLPGPPTGQVAGSGSDFNGDHFIFSTLNGLICGWALGTTAATRATVPGAVYNGLALGTGSDGLKYLYAPNTRGGTIDVFDSNYDQVDSPGGFVDAGLDPKYSPFNVQLVNGVYLFVTYLDTTDADEGGVVNVFDTDGNLLQRFAQDGTLNAPWGVAQAPDSFGDFGGAILIGGFGDGRISAFDGSGNFLGLLSDKEGNPWVFERLWALSFGNGGSGGSTDTLYFTAGINNQQDGLLGSLKPRRR